MSAEPFCYNCGYERRFCRCPSEKGWPMRIIAEQVPAGPPIERLKPIADKYVRDWQREQLLLMAADFVEQYKRNFVAFPLTDFYERLKIILDASR